MSHPQSSNRRLAKNTLMLYIRMLISMLVGLYTSRVVLQTLGVEDYGIYGVVGGIVTMAEFLNASLSRATSRFLTFEMGLKQENEGSRLKDIFSSALIIHVGIAFFVVILAETVGLWFLNNKLVIPDGRLLAANIVYQCSIISMVVGYTQVPYSAAITAHEDISIYTYFDLLGVFLKLGIVFLLVFTTYDSLVFYAILLLCVSVFLQFIYRIFCLKHYPECHFRFVWKPDLLKKMFKFSGWVLFYGSSGSFKTQGTNILINLFYGVSLNAASGIATTVTGILEGLASNSTVAALPQITKAYAARNYKRVVELIEINVKIELLLMSLLTIPVAVCCTDIMTLWLRDVPEYAVDFCRIMFLTATFSLLHALFSSTQNATGQIKDVTIINGTLQMLTIPLIYFLYRQVDSPQLAYWVLFSNIILLTLVQLFFLQKKIDGLSLGAILRNILLSAFLYLIAYYLLIRLSSKLEMGLMRVTVVTLINSMFFIPAYFYLFLTSCQRKKIIGIIKNKGKHE